MTRCSTKLFFLLVLAHLGACVWCAQGAFRSNCPVSQQQADSCAKTLLFEGDRERFIPRNESGMESHCKIMNDKMKCLERHAKCYRAFPRQIFSMVLSHVKKAYKGRCISEPGREEFLHHMSCVKDKASSEPAHKCMDKWSVMMKLISDTFPIPDHFPGVCCSFHLMRDCIVGAVTKVCAESTGPETAKYIERTITAAFSDFLDLACGRQRSVAECRKTFTKGTEILERTIAPGVEPQKGSALFHALRIIIRHDS